MFAAAMDASALVMSVFSPTKTGRVRVAGSRFRYDPYRARVLASPFAAYNQAHATTNSFVTPVPVAAAAPVAPATRSLFTVADAPIRPLTPAISPQKALKKTLADVVASHAASSASVVSPKKKSAAAPKALAAAVAAAAPAKTMQEHWVLVGFKHEAAMYQAPFRVAIGDVVIVEADRGEHIGVVQTITTTAPKYNVPSKVVRHASASEIAMIDELTEKEAKITATTQRFADNFGLSSCRIVDTELQMDGNKLTVFFASKVFVDFRKLQRSLFREFRCRIWLVNWNEVCAYTPVPVNAVPAL